MALPSTLPGDEGFHYTLPTQSMTRRAFCRERCAQMKSGACRRSPRFIRIRRLQPAEDTAEA